MADNNDNTVKREDYKASEIESKWQEVWDQEKIYQPDLDQPKKPFYNLVMFPYPSAEGLHVGSFFTYAGIDAYGRFKRMQGYEVFEPIGLDGFGIHSENFAIKVGRTPQEHARISEENFYRQLHDLGNGFDWSRKLETYDPSYYKWTQWLFIELFKAGLAYKQKATVNFCPSCKTVLSDEQVIDGKCERCSSVVEKRELEQWFFRITDYAERLLANTEKLDWTEKVKIAQKNWIGKKTGALIRFKVEGTSSKDAEIEVFTTRPDTLFGSTFLVLSPEHKIVAEILKQVQDDKKKEVQEYVKKASLKATQERTAEGKEKTGVFSGIYAINPVNNEELPVWIADYVLTDYGTGAIMAVPAHDERDFAFAVKYSLPLKTVVTTPKSTYMGFVKKVWSKDFNSFVKELDALQPVYKQKDAEAVLFRIGENKVDEYIDIAKKSVFENAWHDLVGEKLVVVFGDGEVVSVERFEEASEVWEKMKKVEKSVQNFGGLWEMLFNSVYKESICYTGEGVLINSDEWNGWQVPESIDKVGSWIEEKRFGKKSVNYHLRDWLISRQRYWGPPIPMVFCQSCASEGKSWFTKQGQGARRKVQDSVWKADGWYVEENLPVLLPVVEDFKPLGTGKAPLANYPEFYKTTCPGCGGEAIRETDVSDTFLDSSWYFFRYLATDRDDIPMPMKEAKLESLKAGKKESIRNSSQRLAWLPVTSYIGGAEHAVLHLLYSRFITMVFKDLGYIDFEEPYARFRANGLIIKDGAKMSKSKGNVINPDEYVKKFGADTLRTYLGFIGPFTQGGDFQDSGIEGINRFLKRVWKMVSEFRVQNSEFRIDEQKERVAMLHKTVKGVTEDMEELRFNTAIAKIMTYYNFLSDQMELSRDEIEVLLKLLAPFAPHMTEELWQNVIPSEVEGSPANAGSDKLRDSSASPQNDKYFSSIHRSIWPQYDIDKIASDTVVIAVQVNGKLRDTLEVQGAGYKVQEEVEKLARESGNVKRHLEGKDVKKVIYVPGKILNFVV